MSFLTARGTSLALAWIDRLLILIVAAACAVGQFVIGYVISSVRSQMGIVTQEPILFNDTIANNIASSR